MIRTQIQLPEKAFGELKARARRQGRSMADCVREAIAVYLRGADATARADFEAIAGKFQPVPTDDLKAHDHALIDTILESRS